MADMRQSTDYCELCGRALRIHGDYMYCIDLAAVRKTFPTSTAAGAPASTTPAAAPVGMVVRRQDPESRADEIPAVVFASPRVPVSAK